MIRPYFKFDRAVEGFREFGPYFLIAFCTFMIDQVQFSYILKFGPFFSRLQTERYATLNYRFGRGVILATLRSRRGVDASAFVGILGIPINSVDAKFERRR